MDHGFSDLWWDYCNPTNELYWPWDPICFEVGDRDPLSVCWIYWGP